MNAFHSPEQIAAARRLLSDNGALRESLMIRATPYMFHTPTPKQRLFLLLPQKEAFYGGAAGGGKSDALLMGALQYVDVPGFSAIIFRKTLTDAYRRGAIGDRLREWMHGLPGVRKNGDKFYFETEGSPATIEIAGLANELDKFKYQGAEFQYIAFDELTQFGQADYLYLRSRLRRPRCPLHGGRVIDGVLAPLPDDPRCPTCLEFAGLSRIPLRMRCAANPGGIGHLWVKKRFDIGPWLDRHDERGKPIYHLHPVNNKPIFIGRNPRRPFIPALVTDNPFLDQKEYIEELKELDPVTREQLLNGDWSVSADGRFRKSWVQYYSTNGPYVVLGGDRRGPTHHIDRCHLFIMIDPAASAREGPGDNDIWRNKALSWTVVSTFLVTPDANLVWWDHRRFRGELPEIVQAIKQQFRLHRPSMVMMEVSSLSTHLYQYCDRLGLPMMPCRPGSLDKVHRSIDAANRMERGKVWLPEQAPWLEELESELFTWTGHPDEQDDQIDVLAYASMYVSDWAEGRTSEDSIIDATNWSEHTPGCV